MFANIVSTITSSQRNFLERFTTTINSYCSKTEKIYLVVYFIPQFKRERIQSLVLALLLKATQDLVPLMRVELVILLI